MDPRGSRDWALKNAQGTQGKTARRVPMRPGLVACVVILVVAAVGAAIACGVIFGVKRSKGGAGSGSGSYPIIKGMPHDNGRVVSKQEGTTTRVGSFADEQAFRAVTRPSSVEGYGPWGRAPIREFVRLVPLHTKQPKHFLPSNTAVMEVVPGSRLAARLPPRTAYVLVARLVNYSLVPRAGIIQTVRHGDRWPTSLVQLLLVDDSFRNVAPPRVLEVKGPLTRGAQQCYFLGVEDIRILPSDDGESVVWVGSSCEYGHAPSKSGIRMVMGSLDAATGRLAVERRLQEPAADAGWAMQKNWIPLSPTELVYWWHPFITGSITPGSDPSPLRASFQHSTPTTFAKMCGSTTPLPWGDHMYVLTHRCAPCRIKRRLYFHFLIRLESPGQGRWRVAACSAPFCWDVTGIQFCMGLAHAAGADSDKGEVWTVVTQNDNDPVAVKFALTDIPMYELPAANPRLLLSAAPGRAHEALWVAFQQRPKSWKPSATAMAQALSDEVVVYVVAAAEVVPFMPEFLTFHAVVVECRLGPGNSWTYGPANLNPGQMTGVAPAGEFSHEVPSSAPGAGVPWSDGWVVSMLNQFAAPVTLQWQCLLGKE